MTNGIVMREMCIPAELLNKIHELNRDLGIVSCSSKNTFNICIGGNIVYSTAVG